MSQIDDKPEVTKLNMLDMQVCVPATFTNAEVEDFANHANLCGTWKGWKIRKQGSKLLAGCDERVSCESRPGFVHIMLDA